MNVFAPSAEPLTSAVKIEPEYPPASPTNSLAWVENFVAATVVEDLLLTVSSAESPCVSEPELSVKPLHNFAV